MADDELFRIVEVDPLLLHSERQRFMDLLCGLVPRSCVSEGGSTAVQGLIGKQGVDFAVCVSASALCSGTPRSGCRLAAQSRPIVGFTVPGRSRRFSARHRRSKATPMTIFRPCSRH